jgi:hypothetical protein
VLRGLQTLLQQASRLMARAMTVRNPETAVRLANAAARLLDGLRRRKVRLPAKPFSPMRATGAEAETEKAEA